MSTHDTHNHDGKSCCSHSSTPNLYAQTLDELDFEKSIHYACLNNDINRVKTIISKKGGSTVNEIDSTGYTPLVSIIPYNQFIINFFLNKFPLFFS